MNSTTPFLIYIFHDVFDGKLLPRFILIIKLELHKEIIHRKNGSETVGRPLVTFFIAKSKVLFHDQTFRDSRLLKTLNLHFGTFVISNLVNFNIFNGTL